MNISLRKAQVDAAVKRKNAAMLIWLGKQRLGQRNEPAPPGQADQLATLRASLASHYEHLVAAFGGDPTLNDPTATTQPAENPRRTAMVGLEHPAGNFRLTGNLWTEPPDSNGTISK